MGRRGYWAQVQREIERERLQRERAYLARIREQERAARAAERERVREEKERARLYASFPRRARKKNAVRCTRGS